MYSLCLIIMMNVMITTIEWIWNAKVYPLCIDFVWIKSSHGLQSMQNSEIVNDLTVRITATIKHGAQSSKSAINHTNITICQQFAMLQTHGSFLVKHNLRNNPSQAHGSQNACRRNHLFVLKLNKVIGGRISCMGRCYFGQVCINKMVWTKKLT